MPAKPFDPAGPYTTGDLCEWFGLSVRTIAKWCDDGLIDSYKLPLGHRRITKAALGAFLTRNPTLPRPAFLGYNRPPSSTEGTNDAGPIS